MVRSDSYCARHASHVRTRIRTQHALVMNVEADYTLSHDFFTDFIISCGSNIIVYSAAGLWFSRTLSGILRLSNLLAAPFRQTTASHWCWLK